MASKRKETARAKRLARKHSQGKPGGASKYALKRRRMLGGWDNPRSPIRTSETVIFATDVNVETDGLRDSDGELIAGGAL